MLCDFDLVTKWCDYSRGLFQTGGEVLNHKGCSRIFRPLNKANDDLSVMFHVHATHLQ